MNTISSEDSKIEFATLGGGCFWCIDPIYRQLKGVLAVTSGYMGGHLENPRYKEVCYGNTGHAEVIQISFDPEIISYETILQVFWSIHDPTTLNQQGNDKGTQYRSVIFYHSEIQKEIAEKSKLEEATQLWAREIVTEISEASVYYIAEEDHQDYYNLNPNLGYCRVIINPKIKKFRQRFSELLVKTD